MTKVPWIRALCSKHRGGVTVHFIVDPMIKGSFVMDSLEEYLKYILVLF